MNLWSMLMTQQNDDGTPILATGQVTSFEASSSGRGSDLFSFHLTTGAGGASFQLRPDTPAGMFAAMATVVTTSYFQGRSVQVTSYDQLSSGVYLVNIIRGA
jgi:hypothetical protein